MLKVIRLFVLTDHRMGLSVSGNGLSVEEQWFPHLHIHLQSVLVLMYQHNKHNCRSNSVCLKYIKAYMTLAYKAVLTFTYAFTHTHIKVYM